MCIISFSGGIMGICLCGGIGGWELIGVLRSSGERSFVWVFDDELRVFANVYVLSMSCGSVMPVLALSDSTLYIKPIII